MGSVNKGTGRAASRLPGCRLAARMRGGFSELVLCARLGARVLGTSRHEKAKGLPEAPKPASSLATRREDIATLPPASLLGYKTDYKCTGYKKPKNKALRNSLLRKAL